MPEREQDASTIGDPEHSHPVAETSRRTDATARPFFRRVFGTFARRPAAMGDRDARSAMRAFHALLSERGEVSGARLAREALAAYQTLDGPALDVFFDLLVEEFSPDAAAINAAADLYRHDPSHANLVRLKAAVESPRQELFRRLNVAPGGIGALVKMRRQLLPTLAQHAGRAAIDADLAHLFKSWFNPGFLVLKRIDWRTSALVLERLIEYEAVHQIQGWHDLHRRLEADRRCFAFFHPALPDEPLIFIEVALTRGMSAHVQPLLAPDSAVADPHVADCAIFYSITNCQEGLRGVSFGNFLIKQVAEDLGRELPGIKTFATISPIPGFRRWLATLPARPLGAARSPELVAWLGKAEPGRDWLADDALSRSLRVELSRWCAYYLVRAKQDNVPVDPVARFHLANGARLERINWLGDTSEMGLRRSFGLTANYVYRLSDVEQNHERYAREYTVIVSHRTQRLADELMPSTTAT